MLDAMEASEALEVPEASESEILETEVFDHWRSTTYHGGGGGFLGCYRTGYNLSTDTESVLDPTWREKYLEFEKPPGKDLCKAETEEVRKRLL